MKRGSEKHFGHFVVLEALKTARVCALCDLEVETVRRYLGALLYESVNDPGVRSELARSRGYCHLHAHMLCEFQDGLGTAILYQDQVRMFQECLKSLQGTVSTFLQKQVAPNWVRHQCCPACRIQKDARERYLHTLLESLLVEPMRSTFDASAGLCVPHFMLVLSRTKDREVRQHLLAVESRKCHELLEDLAEFSRKHDYRFAHEGFGKEGDVWRRVVEFMVGREAILGD